jgi:hypothetical protein
MLSRWIVAAAAFSAVIVALQVESPRFLFSARSATQREFPARGSLRAVSPMLEPRSGHAAVLLASGKVLVVGGMRRNQDFYRSAELYDPETQRFSATGSLTVARVGMAAVRLPSGRVLVVGGWTGRETTDESELYDPATGNFAGAGRMTTKRGRPEATLLSTGDVLITGGADHDSPGGIASVELYHSGSGKFEAIAPMHAGRLSHTATLLLDGRVLIAGGRGEKVNASAEMYDPASKTFTLTGDMITPRYKHSAGILPDGRVLVAGGSGAGDWHNKLAAAEIYDLRTGKFTATAELTDARFKLPDEAPSLADGSLLFAGGSTTVDIYEPATGKFVAVADRLPDVRHFMAETKLADGAVLLTGGYPEDDQSTAAAYVYRLR